MLFTTFAWITLVVTAMVAYYLWRVPEGPSCPRCGSATRGVDHVSMGRWTGWLDRWTAERACPVCGWSGRQRLGARPESVQHEARPRETP